MALSFSLIVAMDAARGIGKDGALPWHLSADLKHFKKITTATQDPQKQNAVIMGRKTWDSLPASARPLPHRKNIVVTRNPDFAAGEGTAVIHDFGAWQEVCAQDPTLENVFVIGGEQIFREALLSPYCSAVYLTHIDPSFACDTFFPAFEDQFILEYQEPPQKEGGKTFFFAKYTRKNTPPNLL